MNSEGGKGRGAQKVQRPSTHKTSFVQSNGNSPCKNERGGRGVQAMHIEGHFTCMGRKPTPTDVRAGRLGAPCVVAGYQGLATGRPS